MTWTSIREFCKEERGKRDFEFGLRGKPGHAMMTGGLESGRLLFWEEEGRRCSFRREREGHVKHTCIIYFT